MAAFACLFASVAALGLFVASYTVEDHYYADLEIARISRSGGTISVRWRNPLGNSPYISPAWLMKIGFGYARVVYRSTPLPATYPPGTSDDFSLVWFPAWFMCAVFATPAAWWLTRRWPWGREDFSRCPSCGYNLTGNVSGVCPECGTPISKKAE
jgi:hypothetical protein